MNFTFKKILYSGKSKSSKDVNWILALVEESIQEATWLSLAISTPSKDIRLHP